MSEIVRILVTEERIYYKDVPMEALDDKNCIDIFVENEESFELLDSNYDFIVVYPNEFN